MLFLRPQNIFIYNNSKAETLNLEDTKRYLQKKIKKMRVNLRGSFFSYFLKKKDTAKFARKIAEGKITDINKPVPKEPFLYPAEIEYEIKRIKGGAKEITGIIYDGFFLQSAFRSIIPPQESNSFDVHIILTDQLFATYDIDGRYHLRTVLFGVSSIVSTSGIVEAPARPREFYVLKGISPYKISEWKKNHKEEFIDYDDLRLGEVIKGYLMQVVFYYLLGDPFCVDKNCRLWNAHYQKELIHSQILSPYEFCKFHQNVLKEVNSI